jgi:hypothetical protein
LKEARSFVQFAPKVVYYQQTPPSSPFLGILKIAEGSSWVLSVGTLHKNKIPRTEEGVLQFLEYHNMTKLFQKVKNCKFIAPLHFYHKEGNEYTYFERFPLSGYVAIGDCVCNFNPTYAQGMSTAADAVVLLDAVIRKGNSTENELTKAEE